MNRADAYYLLSVAVTVFGVAVAGGALLDGVVALPVVDGDDLLVGAGIAVAGAGAAVSVRRDRTVDPAGASGR